MSNSDFEYRHFVYLDTEEIMNVAVSMAGFETLSDVRTLTKELRGNVGADLGFKVMGASLSLGGQGARSFRRELQVRHTAYSAVSKVLKELEPKQPTTSDDIRNQKVEEGQVIKCRVILHPPHPVRDAPEKPPLFRRRDRRQPFQSKYGERQDVVVEAPAGKDKDSRDAVLILALSPEWLLKPEEFTRRAIVIGQVVGVKGNGDAVLRQGDLTFDFGRPQNATSPDPDGRAHSVALDAPSSAARTELVPARDNEQMTDRGGRDAADAVLRVRPIAIFK